MSLDKYDSWKLASPDDDPNLVSPCCGEEYTELEFRTEEAMYECSECKELFEYPEQTYEYKQQRLESAQEDKWEANRDES